MSRCWRVSPFIATVRCRFRVLILCKITVLKIIERRLVGRAAILCKKKSRPIDTSFRCDFFSLLIGHIDLKEPTITYSCCKSLDVIYVRHVFTHIPASEWLLTFQK